MWKEVKIECSLNHESLRKALESAIEKIEKENGRPIYLIAPDIWDMWFCRIYREFVNYITLKYSTVRENITIPIAYSHNAELNISSGMLMIAEYPDYP